MTKKTTKNKNNSEIRHLALIVLIILSVSIIALTVLALGAYALPQKPIVLQQFPANNSYFNNQVVFSVKYSEKNLTAVKLNLIIRERNGVETGNISYDLNCASGIPVKCEKAVNVLSYDGKIIEYFFEVSNKYATAKTQIRTIFIDATAPSITISSPVENKIYNASRIDITSQSSEESKWMKQAVNNNIFTILCTRCNSTKRMQFFNEGSQMFSIQALDKAGNLANKIISFTVDSRKPLVLSQSPITNKVLNGTVNFSVSYTEINLKNVTLYILNSTSVLQAKQLTCEAGANKKCSASVDLSDYNGTLRYYFNLRDSINDANSRIVNFNARRIFAVNNTLNNSNSSNFNSTVNNNTNNTANNVSKTLLQNITLWAYQLNTYKNDNLDEIRNSNFQIVVIDYSRDGTLEGEFSGQEIESLKSSGKIVLAYMSIGEAETYRYYWQSSWSPGNPSWLDVENPEWAGNFKVKYWEPGWQSVILGGNGQAGYLNKIMDAGFDGVYMDIIDGYEYYQDKGVSDADRKMVEFVKNISAQAKTRNPDFLIFPQNGEALAQYTDYLDAVDGIGVEDTWYNEDVPNNPADVQQKVDNLLKFRNEGKLVLTVDYVSTPQNIADFYDKSRNFGFVPYATVRALDRLTVN